MCKSKLVVATVCACLVTPIPRTAPAAPEPLPSGWRTDLPPAPPGYWRDDPRDPLLRRIPASIDLTDDEEVTCGESAAMVYQQYEQETYDKCIDTLVAGKKAKAILAKGADAQADATCRSEGLMVGTSNYALCHDAVTRGAAHWNDSTDTPEPLTSPDSSKVFPAIPPLPLPPKPVVTECRTIGSVVKCITR